MAIVDARDIRAGKARRGPDRRRARPIAEILEGRQLLAAITVTSAGDADGADGSNTLSLRQAIEVVNGTLAVSSLTPAQQALVSGPLSTPETIGFAIPGAGPSIIEPATALPAITVPVVIDGYSQAGASPNTGGPGQPDNAVIRVEISGDKIPTPTDFPGDSGLILSGGNSTVQGLAFVNFQQYETVPEGHGDLTFYFGVGILLQGKGDDVVRGNFIGLDTTGRLGTGFTGSGVQDSNSPGAGDTIGGTAPADRNVISGNYDGITSPGGVTIEGNFIGTDPSGARKPSGNLNYSDSDTRSAGVISSFGDTIGGTAAGAGNVISGNDAGIGSNTLGQMGIGLIQGNLIGTDLTGTKPVGNVDGIYNESNSSSTIGGTAAAARNVISGNSDSGIYLQFTEHVLVEGDFVGTDITGTRAVPNGIGVDIYSAGSITIGGMAAGAGNLISGNAGAGLSVIGSSNLVEGNFIGTDPTGTVALPNAGDGIVIHGGDTANTTFVPSNTVGGTAAGAGNIIAFNGKSGVGLPAVSADPSSADLVNTGNTISANSIFSNVGLGIDLGDTGVPTPNNSAGSPTGPNLLQPYPVLTAMTATATGTMISATLDAKPSTSYTVEFFANPAADPTGYGQGKTYLGTTVATTNASGHASFAFSVGSDLAGQFLSATATDPMGNTSEFARDIPSTTPPPPPPVGSSATTTTLIGPAAPSAFGRPTTFAAVVAAAPGVTPTGFVLFGSAGVILGEAPVNAQGVAVLITDLLPPGVDPVAAVYLGDPENATSLSNYVAVTVTPTTPATLLSGPAAATQAGQPVTLAAAVYPRVPGPVPTGMVAFVEGGAVLGEAPLNASARAVFVTDAIPTGDHVVAAVYLGDASYSPSLSNYVSVDVTTKAATKSSTAGKAKAVKPSSAGTLAVPSGPKRPIQVAQVN